MNSIARVTYNMTLSIKSYHVRLHGILICDMNG